LILRLRGSCGILSQRFPLRGRRVPLLLPLTPWRRLRHYAPRWELWLMDSLNALEHLNILKINMELDMKLK